MSLSMTFQVLTLNCGVSLCFRSRKCQSGLGSFAPHITLTKPPRLANYVEWVQKDSHWNIEEALECHHNKWSFISDDKVLLGRLEGHMFNLMFYNVL